MTDREKLPRLRALRGELGQLKCEYEGIQVRLNRRNAQFERLLEIDRQRTEKVKALKAENYQLRGEVYRLQHPDQPDA